MEHDGAYSRRAFLGRGAAFAALAIGGSSWPVGSAAAKVGPKHPVWTTNGRNVTGSLANPLCAVAADAASRMTYFAKVDGGAIQFARSSDDGRTFTPFRTIPGVTNVSDVPLDRSLVVDERTKRLHLLFTVDVDDSARPAALLYMHSDDGGESWSTPLKLDDGSGSTGRNHGTNRFIRVAMAARNGVVHIGWSSISNTTFLTDGLFYVRSSNGGGSFSSPREPFPGAVSPSRPDIALSGSTVLLTWTDARYGSAYNGNPGEVFVGRSVDGGVTWTQRRLTFTANRWGAGTTLRPVICAAANGTATVVWQDPNAPAIGGAGGPTGRNSAGTEDLYWVHSANAGRTWGKEHLLARAASSQEHAYLAQRGNAVVCVWSDHSSSPHQVRAKLSTNGGGTFGPTVRPIAATADVGAPIVVVSASSFQLYAAEGGNGVFSARLAYPPR